MSSLLIHSDDDIVIASFAQAKILDEVNILQAITGQRPFEIGSMAVEAAVKVLRGEKVEKKVSLPGFLLSREKPDEVKQFKDRLMELSK